ncbi:MAG: hypothetical protein DLM57_00060 [Pseudonocardiales bacterium]|nr:MAG: hypothetical protein DLM57_00060 [Pseudonocardiales bacterium]
MIKKVSLAIVFVVGLTWVAATFIFNLWSKAPGVDGTTKVLRPAFSNAGVAQEQKDINAVNGVVTELKTVTIPFLATQLKVTPAAATTLLASKFPAVGVALGTTDTDGKPYADGKTYLEHAAGYLTTVVTTIKAQQPGFKSAESIPTKDIPTIGLTWLFLVLGIVVLLVAALVILKPGLGRVLAAVVVVVGIVVIAVTYVLDVPGKTQGVDNITNAFRPVYKSSGPLSINTGAKYLAGVRAADVEIETKVVPALPGLLNVPLATVVTALQTNSPKVSAALLGQDPADRKISVLAGILGRFDALAAKVKQSSSDFKKTDGIPGLGWPTTIVQFLLVGPAVLLILAGLGLLLAGRARPRADT